jgi:hypothetical protein
MRGKYMKKVLWAIGLFLILAVGYIAAGPFLTVWAIKTAIVEQDAEKLSGSPWGVRSPWGVKSALGSNSDYFLSISNSYSFSVKNSRPMLACMLTSHTEVR